MFDFGKSSRNSTNLGAFAHVVAPKTNELGHVREQIAVGQHRPLVNGGDKMCQMPLRTLVSTVGG
jgi:hypothetical protein